MLKTEEEKPTSLLNSQARDIVLTRSKFCSLSIKKEKLLYLGIIYNIFIWMKVQRLVPRNESV